MENNQINRVDSCNRGLMCLLDDYLRQRYKNMSLNLTGYKVSRE